MMTAIPLKPSEYTDLSCPYCNCVIVDTYEHESFRGYECKECGAVFKTTDCEDKSC